MLPVTFICATFYEQQMFSGCAAVHFIFYRAAAEEVTLMGDHHVIPTQTALSYTANHGWCQSVLESAQAVS